MGVVFFIMNAVFALVLLVLVLISSLYAIFSKNPDTRYQPMRDDRASFTKSQTQLNTELDALGATARGDPNASYKRRDLDDDASSLSSTSYGKLQHDAGATGMPSSPTRSMMTAPSQRPMTQRSSPSPVDPSLPLFPSGGAPRHEQPPPPPPNYSNTSQPMYGSPYGAHAPPGSELPLLLRGGVGSEAGTPVRAMSPAQHDMTTPPYRQPSGRDPWQRGTGYDH